MESQGSSIESLERRHTHTLSNQSFIKKAYGYKAWGASHSILVHGKDVMGPWANENKKVYSFDLVIEARHI